MSYQPTSYGNVNDTSAFWGSLFDAQGQPSQVLSRYTDALFFYLDAHAQVRHRNSGHIEPDKYAWWLVALGQESSAINFITTNCTQELWDLESVPYRLVQVPNQGPMWILDRRAWLHTIVSDFKCDSADALLDANKTLAAFNLLDPMTNLPFPYPIPPSAIANCPVDWNLKTAITSWQTRTGIALQVAKSRAEWNTTFAATMAAYSTPAVYPGLGVANPYAAVANPYANLNANVNANAMQMIAQQQQVAQTAALQAQAEAKKQQSRASLIRTATGLATTLLTGNVTGFGS